MKEYSCKVCEVALRTVVENRDTNSWKRCCTESSIPLVRMGSDRSIPVVLGSRVGRLDSRVGLDNVEKSEFS